MKRLFSPLTLKVGHLPSAETSDEGNLQRTSPAPPPPPGRGAENAVTSSVSSVVSGVASLWKAFPWSK